MDVMGWVKAHPYSTGAIVLGGFVGIFLLTRGGGGTTVVAGSGGSATDPAATAAANQLAAAQIAAGVQGQAIDADVAKSKDTNTVALGIASLQQQLGLATVSAQQNVSLADIAAKLQSLFSNNETGLAITNSNNATANTVANLQFVASVNATNVAGDIEKARIGAGVTTTQAIIDAFKPVVPDATPVTGGTVNPPTPQQSFNNLWDEYLYDNPDVNQGFFDQHPDLTKEEAAQLHYQVHGQYEDRILPDALKAAV